MIIKWQHACKFLDHAEYALCIFIDLDVSFLTVADIHLSILFYLSDTKIKNSSRSVFAGCLSCRDQCGIFIIYCNKYTEVSADLIDTALHHISRYIRSSGGKIMIHFHSCTESAALIYIKSYQALLTFTYSVGLLMVWKKKILLQSPVKKSSYSGDLFNLEDCCLSHLEHRLTGSRDQSVLRIFVDEYLDLITYFGSFRYLFGWKKHTLVLRCISVLSKIYSEIYGFYNQ